MIQINGLKPAQIRNLLGFNDKKVHSQDSELHDVWDQIVEMVHNHQNRR